MLKKNATTVDQVQHQHAIQNNMGCIATTPELVWTTPVDVVVEMTGTIHEAFEWITNAIKIGNKKVVSFNAELDASLRPDVS